MSDADDSAGLFLGIDVGGTDVKVGLVNKRGSIVHRSRKATTELGSPENVFRFAVDFANKTLKATANSQRLLAAGVAVPGVLDTNSFVLKEVVNLPGWQGVPLRDQLADVSQLKSIVVNDANGAAFAEHAIRQMQNASLGLVTLGTGVGCGVVVGGGPCGGDHGCAGELGHITIDFSDSALECTCGSKGHLETYAGANGVVRRTRELLKAVDADDPWLHQDFTPLDVAQRAESGDNTCLQVIDQTAVYIGRAIGLMGQVIDPAVVLLGGAMTFGGADSIVGERFLAAVRASVKSSTLVQVGENIKIEFASLGNDAGMIGAGMLAKSICSGL